MHFYKYLTLKMRSKVTDRDKTYFYKGKPALEWIHMRNPPNSSRITVQTTYMHILACIWPWKVGQRSRIMAKSLSAHCHHPRNVPAKFCWNPSSSSSGIAVTSIYGGLRLTACGLRPADSRVANEIIKLPTLHVGANNHIYKVGKQLPT